MITLSDLRPTPRWQAVTLSNGDSLQVQITPPTYDQIVAVRVEDNVAASVLQRLACITDWRDVYQATADGGQTGLPFSLDALGVLIRDCPGVLGQLLAIVRPDFDGLTEDRRKNSPEPRTAATSENRPSPATTTSGSSDNSPAN